MSEEEVRKQAIGMFIATLESQSPEVVVLAKAQLLLNGQDAIKPLIEKGLIHASWRVREHSIDLLVDLEAKDAIPNLEHIAKRDPFDNLKVKAGEAIKKLKGEVATTEKPVRVLQPRG